MNWRRSSPNDGCERQSESHRDDRRSRSQQRTHLDAETGQRRHHAILGANCRAATACATRYRMRPARCRTPGIAQARTIVLRFLRLKSRGMPARASALQKPGGSSWLSSRSAEGDGATMSQSEANGCRFANYRAPAIGSCRPRACCSIPPRRRRSAPITLDSRWPRQCDVRCD